MSDVKNRKLYVNEREIISDDIVNKISNNLVNNFSEKRRVKLLMEELKFLGKDFDKLVDKVNDLIDEIYEKKKEIEMIDEDFSFNYFYINKLSKFKSKEIKFVYEKRGELKNKINVDLVKGGCSDNLVDYVDELIKKYS